MDQGFSPQGFSAAPAIRVAARVPHHVPVPHAPHPVPHGTRPHAAETAAKGAASTAKRSNGATQRVTAEQQQINNWQRVKSWFMAPTTLEIGSIFAGALAWVPKKLGMKRTAASIKMAINSSLHALRTTPILELFRLPANFLNHARGEATALEATGMAESAGRYAKSAGKAAEEMEARAGRFFKPLTGAVTRGVERFEASGVGKGLRNGADRLMHHRKAAAIVKHDAALAGAHEALTTEARVGFKQKIGGFFGDKFKGTKPATIHAGELSHITHELNAAASLSGADKVTRLQSLAEQLKAVVSKEGVAPEVAARAGNVMSHVEKALSSAGKIETYGKAAGAGLKGLMKAAGRVPVFHALLTAGIVAGIGATLLTSKAESKAAKAAFDDLSAQLGGRSDSGFLQAVKAAHKSQKGWGKAKTGLEVAGNVVDSAMWMMPGGGGMAMMGAMLVPQMIGGLVPDNPALGALVALQKEGRGELNLDREAKIELVRQLVGLMPAVAAKGGVYNRLTTPIATEIVERGMTPEQIVQLLGNNAAFTQVTSEVAAKRAEQAKTPGTVDTKAPAANDAGAAAPAQPAAGATKLMSAAEMAYHHAEKPTNLVAANDAHAAGKVAELHRHVG
ncbi:MAG: hypothetical protein SFW64_06980 [Alphaproteobacteria bacterium]|nr:hypothetical protein [Alphaproteobacteria bacterium]